MATLSDLRTDLKRASQRHELSDANLSAYLNAGQELLDQMAIDSPGLRRRYMGVLANGDHELVVTDLISVQRLTIIDSTNGRSDITENFYSPARFREEAPDLIADWDSNTPYAWTFNTIHLPDSQGDQSAATFASAGVLDYDDVTFHETDGSQYKQKGILFYPKADEAYTIEVVGLFRSKTLSSDTDVSYWTIVRPYLLVLAACFVIEREMRDTAGMKTWMDAIEHDLSLMDTHAVVDEWSGLSTELDAQS